MRNIVSMEARLRTDGLTEANLLQAKKWGFTDRTIGRLTGKEEFAIREERKTLGILPTHKMVDTCAAEFEAATPYYYSAYAQEDEVVPSDRRKVMVLGLARFASAKGWSLTTARCILLGPCVKWALKASSTIRKR